MPIAPSKSDYKSLNRAASTRRSHLNPNENRIQRRNSALGANPAFNRASLGNSACGRKSTTDRCFADTRSEMAASLRTLIRSRSEQRHPSRSRTTSASDKTPTNTAGGWVQETTDNNGSIPSRGIFIN